MTTPADEQALSRRIELLEVEIASLQDDRARLAAAEARWQALMDESPFGVVVYRPDGTVKAGGQGMNRLFNLSEEEASFAQSVYNILEDSQLTEKGLAEVVQKAFAGESAALPCIEYKLQGPIENRATSRWLEGVFFPVFDPDGNVQEVVSIQTDVSELMKSQQDLQGSQDAMSKHLRELDHLYATEPVGLCLVDTDLRFLRINERMAAINGPSVADHLGRTVQDVAPAIAGNLERLYRRVIDTGEPMLNLELHGIAPADPETKRDWLVSYYPIKDDDGLVVAISSVVQEITEIVRTEKALEKSQRQLQAVIDTADLFLWALDRDGIFTLSEGRALARLGLEPGQIVGRSVFEVYADQPEILAHNRRALEGEAASGTVALGDLIFAARYLPVFDQDDQPSGAIGIAIDITERQKVEAALEKSEQQFRQIAENLREVVWRLDLESLEITYVSPAWEKIWGQPIEEFYSRQESWLEDFHPNEQERVREFIERLARSGGNDSLEARIVRNDGELRWLAIRASSVEDVSGNVHRLVGTAEDITEAKRKDEERERLEARVLQAQKMESLGHLAGGIAHDFNNLLMGVLGNAELALLSITPESPGREHVSRIRGTAQKAAELANQMLAYSGKGKYVVGALDLNRLIREMRHLLESVVSKNVRLSIDLAQDLPPIEADASQIRQVVMNLITNASEAMEDQGGSARVETSLFEADHIYLSQCAFGTKLKPGQCVRLTVADTGPGISDEIRGNIFDPFFTTKFTGRGLGLAAALGIVQSHGAALRVDSDPATGALFSILFPHSTAIIEPPITTPPAVIDGEAAGGTILIVDDEPVVRDVARAMLQSAKYKVFVASDGTEAVEIFEKDGATIDLVILDMAMPEMDGRETYEALRAIRNDVLVLLSSGYTEKEAISQLGASGVVDFVHKPYKLKTLLEMVRKALAG